MFLLCFTRILGDKMQNKTLLQLLETLMFIIYQLFSHTNKWTGTGGIGRGENG